MHPDWLAVAYPECPPDSDPGETAFCPYYIKYILSAISFDSSDLLN